MPEEKKVTHTAEGTPVGPSHEEEKLRELHRDDRLPEDAKLRGLLDDDHEAEPKE